jgi:hypothetical protein
MPRWAREGSGVLVTKTSARSTSRGSTARPAGLALVEGIVEGLTQTRFRQIVARIGRGRA